MTQSELLELAKQGEPYAIASLMNVTLQPKGITAKVDIKETCLYILLESDQSLNQQTLVTFVYRGLVSLQIPSVQTVKVYGKRSGENLPGWVQEFRLDPVAYRSNGNGNGRTSGDIADAPPFASAAVHGAAVPRPRRAWLPWPRYGYEQSIPMAWIALIAFLTGGVAALLVSPMLYPKVSSDSPVAPQPGGTQATATPDSPASGAPAGMDTREREAIIYVTLMNKAQQTFHQNKKRFARNLEELERSANLISRSYGYTYRVEVTPALAQVKAIAREEGLRSYTGLVFSRQGLQKWESLICQTDQPSAVPPILSAPVTTAGATCPIGTSKVDDGG